MRSLKNALVKKVNPKTPDPKITSLGARLIRSGRLVAFPTETVYGIAANLLDKKAIKQLYKIKNRPGTKPFTVHISSLGMIEKLGCSVSKEARALIRKFWPGPITIILRSRTGKKIGFRMPANKTALELIKKARVPVVAPSANLSGKTAPKCAADVLRDLDGMLDLVIDSGRTDVGIESTVIDMTVKPPVILREGAISSKHIYKVLGDRS